MENGIPSSHFNLAFILYNFGEYEEALNEYERAFELRPDWEDAYYQSSLILMEEKRWQKAIELLNNLIKIHGSFEIFGYTYRASCFLMIDDLSKAEADCKEAIKINSKFDMPYFIYGLIHFKKEEFSKAKDRIAESLKLNNQNSDATYYLGQIYVKTKKYNLAKESLKKALLLFNSQKEKLLERIEEEKKKSRIQKAEKLKTSLEEIILKIKNCEATLTNLENLK